MVNLHHRLSVVDLLFVVLKKLHMYIVIYMWSIFNKSDYHVGIITGMLSVYCFHRVHRNESRCLPQTCLPHVPVIYIPGILTMAI